jgi:hypothetical protein
MDSVESFFLKYAFPCAHVLVQVGAMSEENHERLEASAKGGDLPSRDVLESSFPAAFRRIREVAIDMNIEDYWDMRVMKAYWHGDHNLFIDRRDGGYEKFPDSFCDFCKVHVAEVVEIFDNGFLLIEYDGKRRPVCGEYVGPGTKVPQPCTSFELDRCARRGVKVGDKVRIHHAYAVERVI